MKGKNLNWMPNLVRWLFSILNSCSPTNLRQRILSFIILASVTFAAYLVFDWMGLHDYFCYILGKVEYRVILQGIRVVVFQIFGPFAIPFCSVLGLGYSICFMDPAEGQPAAGGDQPAAGGGQPAANPVAQEPANNAPAQAPAQDDTNQPYNQPNGYWYTRGIIEDYLKTQMDSCFDRPPSSSKHRRVFELAVGENFRSQPRLLEVLADISANPERNPSLDRAKEIMNDIYEKKVKDRDLDRYEFDDE